MLTVIAVEAAWIASEAESCRARFSLLIYFDLYPALPHSFTSQNTNGEPYITAYYCRY